MTISHVKHISIVEGENDCDNVEQEACSKTRIPQAQLSGYQLRVRMKEVMNIKKLTVGHGATQAWLKRRKLTVRMTVVTSSERLGV